MNFKHINTSNIQDLIQRGTQIHGDNFKNYLDNFPIVKHDNILNFRLHHEDLLTYGDTFGNPALRLKIAQRESAKYQTTFSQDNVLITNGSTQGLFLCNQMLKYVGYKKVYIPCPSFSGYKDICEVLKQPYYAYDMQDGFSHSVFEQLFKTKEKALIIVNSPHNPTGAFLSQENIDFLKAKMPDNIMLVFDCVYDELIYDGKEVLNWQLLLSNDKIFKRCFFLNSFSKNFGLPGLRLGWVTSHPDNIAYMEPFLERNLISINTISQKIALQVLSQDYSFVRNELKERRDYLCAKLANLKDHISFDIPKAGTSIIVKSLNIASTEVFEYLLEQGVGVLPGEAYFGGQENTFRLSFVWEYNDLDNLYQTLYGFYTRINQELSI